MDEEIAERHAAQSNEFHSRQYSERAKENVARSDDLARGAEHWMGVLRPWKRSSSREKQS